MPMDKAYSSIFWKNVLLFEAMPGTFIALTVFPRKGLKSVDTKMSEISIISRGLRRSGLSVPYFSMASAYVMRLKGAEENSFPPPNF